MINDSGVISFGSWSRLLKFCSGQNWASCKISTFDPNYNAISGNLQYRIQHSPLSDSYPYASIWLTIQELRSLKFISGCWKSGSGQNKVTWAIQSFSHLRNENSENFENQSHRELQKVSDKCLTSRFRDGIWKLGLFEVDGFSGYNFPR
jgi:hypothetical protein